MLKSIKRASRQTAIFFLAQNKLLAESQHCSNGKMLYQKYISSLLLVLSITFCKAQLSDATTRYIDSAMNAAYKPNQPGGVLLIAKDGKVIYKKAFGLANVERAIPLKNDNAFGIGSMTKQFTAVAILQLAQQGKLSLQDDIRKHLPDYSTHNKNITIEQLLTHTSGVAEIPNRRPGPSSNTIDFMMNEPLLFEPGTDWSYVNAGYLLLPLIIEKISGLSYNDYVQKNIFDVVGMKYSSFWHWPGKYEKTISGVATGYVSGENNSIVSVGYPRMGRLGVARGNGNIISTVDDLLQWDEALYSDKVVGREWLHKAWTQHHLNGSKMYYGYGWGLQTINGVECIQHGGSGVGYQSNGVRIPSEHVYVVLLTNTEMQAPFYLSLNIALKVVNRPIAKHVSFPLTPEKAMEYSGAYQVHHNDFSHLCCFEVTSQTSKDTVYRYIQINGNTLYEQRGDKKNDLIYLGNDTFCFKDYDNYFLKFQRDREKKINAV